MRNKVTNNIAIRVILLLIILFFINGAEFFHHHTYKEDNSNCPSCLLVNTLSSTLPITGNIIISFPHFEIFNFSGTSTPLILKKYFKYQLRAPPVEAA